MTNLEEERRRDQIEADITVLVREIIPDLREQLSFLTRLDYDPEKNSDHEYRDADMEFLSAELAQEVKDLRKLLAM